MLSQLTIVTPWAQRGKMRVTIGTLYAIYRFHFYGCTKNDSQVAAGLAPALLATPITRHTAELNWLDARAAETIINAQRDNINL